MATSRQEKAKAAVAKMRAAEQASRTAGSRAEKVKAAVAKIRAFYELGQNLPATPTHKDAYGHRLMETEEKRLRLSQDTLRKARVFADCARGGYTPEQVEELCRLIRDLQPGQDEGLAVFQRTHLVRLLSVRPDRRAALQERCVRKGWSTAELEAEIARRYGTRREGGRRRKIPPDLTGFLVQLESMCEEWRRWKEELSRDPDEVTDKHVLLAVVPEKLRKQIQTVSKLISTLQRDVVEELKQVQPGRKIRGGLQTGANDHEGAAGRRREG